jgi:endonuclease YncB( thermonuclease family)
MRLTYFIILIFYSGIAWSDSLSGRVVRVTDGNTIVVLDSNQAQHKIRLQGIDAPELGQAYGTQSKEHLSDAVAGKNVVVEYDKRDRDGRIVGKVLLSSDDMNLRQVEAGLAWHHKKYQNEQTTPDRVKYSDAELEARRVRRGLWADKDPVPPWKHRQAKRQFMKDMQPFMGKPRVNQGY